MPTPSAEENDRGGLEVAERRVLDRKAESAKRNPVTRRTEAKSPKRRHAAGEDVAIKILPPHLSSNPELKARFEREARAVSSLNHPHICHLYDIGSQDGRAFLVMEYLDGETLADRLRKAPLPLMQALEFGIRITEALATAHRAGILHRDLKPGNVMLIEPGISTLTRVAHSGT